MCNIDCSQTNFNPLCASDGKSYDNACQIKEASCQKQEKIEVMSLGRCQGNSHNKTHFKECFQFLFREKKKKITRAGFLFGNCYISIRLRQFVLWSTGCGERQMQRGVRGAPLLSLAMACPQQQQGTAQPQPCSGFSISHQCPAQSSLPRALSARQQLEQDRGNAPQTHLPARMDPLVLP